MGNNFKILIFIIVLAIVSCKANKCPSQDSIAGAYRIKTYTNESLDITLDLNIDGSFIHRYRKKDGHQLVSKGHWSFNDKSCSINLKPWYSYGRSNFDNKPVWMSASLEENKIIPYEDVPIYLKVKQE